MNLGSFYSANFLEESMSFIEKTAKKLAPILAELKKRMIPDKLKQSKLGRKKVETLESANDFS